MLISIVMITYNHEKYIEKAIESALAQEGKFEIELLIGNDKSPDNTEEILKKYQNNKKIRIFNREKNLGATKNLLDLFLKSNGDYIAILEGDDYWVDKRKLEKQLEILENNKEYSLCYTNSDIIDENSIKVGEKKVVKEKINNFKALIANSGEIPTGTVMFRDIFKGNKRIDDIKKLLISGEIIGDLSLFSILIKYGKFIKLNEITGAYRYITNSNISSSYSSKKDVFKKSELYKVTKGIKEYYKEKSLYIDLLVVRRKYELVREIEKLNEDFSKYEVKKDFLIILYKLIKPFHDLSLSYYKRIYK